MSDEEPNQAIVRCLRVEELDNPTGQSEVRACSSCGGDVWFDVTLIPLIAEDRPGADVVLICTRCSKAESRHAEVRVLPAQVRILRAQGATDEQIAYVFALAQFEPTRNIEAAALQLQAYPRGPEAQRFLEVLRRVRVLVALS